MMIGLKILNPRIKYPRTRYLRIKDHRIEDPAHGLKVFIETNLHTNCFSPSLRSSSCLTTGLLMCFNVYVPVTQQ